MLRFSKEPRGEEGEEGGGEEHVGEVAQTTYTLINKCVTMKTFTTQSEDMFSRTLV
jgi:hypothetical protein